MFLIFLTFLTAFLMEGIGSYMSVVGWNSILVGDWVVISLFIVLDLAKIVALSFLYQTWTEIKKTWRAYLTFAVVFLMILTSAGSFGYLSSSFQQAIAPNKQLSITLDAAKTQRESLQAEKKQLTESKIKIENQIAKLPDDTVGGRARLIANFAPEQKIINAKMAKIDTKLETLDKSVEENSKVEVQKDTHIGPIVYFAKAFDWPLEKVVTWAILSIIFVFDPLAMSMVLAGNFLLLRRKNKATVKSINPMMESIVKNAPMDEEALKKKWRKEVEEEILDDVKAVLDEEPVQQPEVSDPNLEVEPPAEKKT